MADANPSGPRYVGPLVRPEQNLVQGERLVKRFDGKTVIRRTMTNGNVLDTMVFPGDYPNAVSEAQLVAEKAAADARAAVVAEAEAAASQEPLVSPAPTPTRKSKS